MDNSIGRPWQAAIAGFLYIDRFEITRFKGTSTLHFNKHLTTAIIAGFMFGAAPAYAEGPDYWLIRVSDDHTLFYFIDASTLTSDGPFRSVWLTEITAGKEFAKNAGKKVAKNIVRRKMILTQFDCKHNDFRENRVVTYDNQAIVLADHSHDDGAYRQITPESIDAPQLEFVCENSDSWASRKGWAEIDVAPEKISDNDYKAFQTHQSP